MSFNETGGARHLTQVKNLRKEIIEAIRAMAGVIKLTTHKQRIIDLVTRLGVSGETDYSILPSQPEGFVVSNTMYIKNGTGNLRAQCEFQMITMMVTYFFLFSQTKDIQDLRSAHRYKGWIMRYVENHHDYEVCGGVRSGFWLCNTSVLKQGQEPTLPKWLKADGGETV
jgi:hypothetical protein